MKTINQSTNQKPIKQSNSALKLLWRANTFPASWTASLNRFIQDAPGGCFDGSRRSSPKYQQTSEGKLPLGFFNTDSMYKRWKKTE